VAGPLTMPVLSFTPVTETSSPEKWLYIVHGVFGAGRNWNAVAKRVVKQRPEWGALLIDLREHGASQGFPPPHTISASAADIGALARATGKPPAAMLGHSFGGKVTLAVVRDHAQELGLGQVWIIDSTPAASPPRGSAREMFEVVKTLPPGFDSRDAAIEALTAHGVLKPTAQWMVTNLHESGGTYRWRFRLDSIEALLQDFFATDLWDVLESPPAGVDIHLVRASESSLLSGETLARVERARDDRHVFLHTVTGGHWLNADNPDALVELLTANLPKD
jgi:pimeloyl-ACP methyl ester carboxylesterase